MLPPGASFMNNSDCVHFLQWSLPKLQMRWPGFRKVRKQVCKRIQSRVRELSLPDVTAYRSYLESRADEWAILDSFCRISISRFYRDREVFHFLEHEVIPKLSEAALSHHEKELRCWSIGCASGEEPYTLALLWDFALARQFPALKIRTVATDTDKVMLQRAAQGCYTSSSLKELPLQWRRHGFIQQNDRYCMRKEEREKVDFILQDVRREAPDGLFHLILCRNLVFTYFDETLQIEVLGRLRDKLSFRGAIVVGIHETLPSGCEGFERWPGTPGVYRKSETGSEESPSLTLSPGGEGKGRGT